MKPIQTTPQSFLQSFLKWVCTPLGVTLTTAGVVLISASIAASSPFWENNPKPSLSGQITWREGYPKRSSRNELDLTLTEEYSSGKPPFTHLAQISVTIRMPACRELGRALTLPDESMVTNLGQGLYRISRINLPMYDTYVLTIEVKTADATYKLTFPPFKLNP